MKHKLTEHAQHVIAERGIQTEWIVQVLEKPERVEPDVEDSSLEHRFGKIAQHGNRVLRVVVNIEIDPVQVVTVYFDRAMRGKL